MCSNIFSVGTFSRCFALALPGILASTLGGPETRKWANRDVHAKNMRLESFLVLITTKPARNTTFGFYDFPWVYQWGDLVWANAKVATNCDPNALFTPGHTHKSNYSDQISLSQSSHISTQSIYCKLWSYLVENGINVIWSMKHFIIFMCRQD